MKAERTIKGFVQLRYDIVILPMTQENQNSLWSYNIFESCQRKPANA
jgi:hypothetical protein